MVKITILLALIVAALIQGFRASWTSREGISLMVIVLAFGALLALEIAEHFFGIVIP